MSVNPEAEACERLANISRSLRISVLHGATPGAADAKREAVLVAMVGLLDEFGLVDLAGQVLDAREHFEASVDSLPRAEARG